MRISVRQALLGLFLLGSSVLGQVQAGEPIRVLFVGHSYTFVNDLPARNTGSATTCRTSWPRPTTTTW